MANQDDWALVVGVKVYPDLGDLDGPEIDAAEFLAWVTSPTGGDVPPTQARKIVSSDFIQPFPSVIGAEPTAEAIQEFFDTLAATAEQNGEAGKGTKAGRRLYLYFSGHGFAPTLEDAALLMANATRKRPYHFAGRSWANWFFKAGFFEEVLLFMDCCRELYTKITISVPPWVDVIDPDSVTRAKRLYAYATKWSRLTRERVMTDGRVHGVFTTALLQGLRGGASNASGEITAMTLSSYLYNNVALLLDPADRDNDEIAKEPDIYAPNLAAHDFVIVKVPPLLFGVRIRVGADCTVHIRGNNFAIIKTVNVHAPETLIDLPRGVYLAETIGKNSVAFEVAGINANGHGVVDVAL